MLRQLMDLGSGFLTAVVPDPAVKSKTMSSLSVNPARCFMKIRRGFWYGLRTCPL